MAKNERTSISISQRTRETLDSIKHTGQSYNGLLQELVKFWKEKKGGVSTKRGVG